MEKRLKCIEHVPEFVKMSSHLSLGFPGLFLLQLSLFFGAYFGSGLGALFCFGFLLTVLFWNQHLIFFRYSLNLESWRKKKKNTTWSQMTIKILLSFLACQSLRYSGLEIKLIILLKNCVRINYSFTVKTSLSMIADLYF